jgi:hypothetical protein
MFVGSQILPVALCSRVRLGLWQKIFLEIFLGAQEGLAARKADKLTGICEPIC